MKATFIACFTFLVICLQTNPALARKISGNFSGDVEKCQSYRLCIIVDKADQRMYAFYRESQTGTLSALGPVGGWDGVPISTARSGKTTPTGLFSVDEVAGRWRTSNRYDGAALYYAMQLHGNIFLHATSNSNYKYLGQKASAGCIRTTLKVAEFLNAIMTDIGAVRNGVLKDKSNVRILVK